MKFAMFVNVDGADCSKPAGLAKAIRGVASKVEDLRFEGGVRDGNGNQVGTFDAQWCDYQGKDLDRVTPGWYVVRRTAPGVRPEAVDGPFVSAVQAACFGAPVDGEIGPDSTIQFLGA